MRARKTFYNRKEVNWNCQRLWIWSNGCGHRYGQIKQGNYHSVIELHSTWQTVSDLHHHFTFKLCEVKINFLKILPIGIIWSCTVSSFYPHNCSLPCHSLEGKQSPSLRTPLAWIFKGSNLQEDSPSSSLLDWRSGHVQRATASCFTLMTVARAWTSWKEPHCTVWRLAALLFFE